MRRVAVSILALAGCDPMWGVDVKLQHPGRMPIEDATLAVACSEGNPYASSHMAVHTRADGKAYVGGLGNSFPVGCDIFVAKPGFVTQRIRYRDLCPTGPENCNRVFHLDLVMEPAT